MRGACASLWDDRVVAEPVGTLNVDIGLAASPLCELCSSADSVTGDGNLLSSSSPRSSIFDVEVPISGVGGIDSAK